MSQTLPSANDLWSMALPQVDGKAPTQHFYDCIVASLPKRHAGHLYKASAMDAAFAAFLAEAADAPVLRIAGVIALLDKMASDSTFEEGDRKHVDQDKTALFWRIIGQEIPIDAKSASGNGWPAGFIASLPAQASRVLDDCHLWTYGKAWPAIQVFSLGGVAKDQVEPIFAQLQEKVQSPVYIEELRQKLIHGEHGVNTLQQLIYTFFIKLGLLERAIWAKEPRVIEAHQLEAVEKQRDTQPVESWATRVLENPISRTRACIKALCEELAVPTVGGLDDTTRAQIRAIPEKMTSKIGGIQFLEGYTITWQSQMEFSSLAPPGMPFFFQPAITPQMVRQRNGWDFIKEQARQMQCWKD